MRHSDACIYSPGVIICKTDESIPKRMLESEFVTVDVISCAAPDLKKKPYNRYNPETGRAINVDNKELYDIHLKRARHILHIAAANRVDILVLLLDAAHSTMIPRSSQKPARMRSSTISIRISLT